MVKSVIYIVFLMLLTGCLATKVDGNRVNYANGMSFEISEAYTSVGRAPFIKPITSYGDDRPGVGTSVIHVFAKKDTQYKDTTEFIGVYALMLPSRWYMRHPGMVSGLKFQLDLKSFPAVADLLKDSGVKSESKYLCEENFLYTYKDGQQSISYCVAENIVPSGEDQHRFLKTKFADSVRLVSGNEVQIIPQSSISDKKLDIVRPQDDTAPSKGKYVVIAHSVIANATYTGRSYKSNDDALNNAVTGCNYSDCRKVWVSHVDGCVAFAKHSSGAWGKARGADVSEATAKALKLCNAYTKAEDCAVLATLCPEY